MHRANSVYWNLFLQIFSVPVTAVTPRCTVTAKCTSCRPRMYRLTCCLPAVRLRKRIIAAVIVSRLNCWPAQVSGFIPM